MSEHHDLLHRQARALVASHAFVGATVADLVQFLEHCREVRYEDGDALCWERSAGQELMVLVGGMVSVQKRDARGGDRELARVRAPALIGHMSLVDGSPRSATCRAAGVVVCRVLDRGRYLRLIEEPGPVGSTLRRLLLSSLHKQLSRANAYLRKLVGGEPLGPSITIDDGERVVSMDDLALTSLSLSGYEVEELTTEEGL